MKRQSQEQQSQQTDGSNVGQQSTSDNNNDEIAQNGSRNSTANLESEGLASSPDEDFSSSGSTGETISSSMTNNSNKNDEGVGTLREYDVLMGRGSGPNRHEGNIHFRAIVGEVFDEFLSQTIGASDSLNSRGRSEMLRIDPSTKNRLAQAVLDKITIEKNGRFLQKLTKKEILDATSKGTSSDLIRARANSMDAAAMTAEAMAAEASATESASESDIKEDANNQETINTIVYYKIIPEKQILAKIKQTFRFLRDKNEASYFAEKHRQRAKRMACRGNSRGACLSASSSSFFSLNSRGLPGNCSFAAYALLSQNPSLGAAMNINPLSRQLNFASSAGNGVNSLNGLSNGNNLWAGRNITTSMGNIPSKAASSLSSLSSLKNCTLNNGVIGTTSRNMDLASRILCDLPQPNRIISGPNSLGGSSLMLNGSSSLVAMGNAARGVNNSSSSFLNKGNSSADQATTKRLLEELTLSRLVDLQKQRDQTISAYLSLERGTGGSSAGSSISPIERLFENVNGTNSSGSSAKTTLALPSDINRNHNSVANSTPDSLTLLLQLQSNSSSGTNINRSHRQLASVSTGKNALRVFNSI